MCDNYFYRILIKEARRNICSSNMIHSQIIGIIFKDYKEFDKIMFLTLFESLIREKKDLTDT